MLQILWGILPNSTEDVPNSFLQTVLLTIYTLGQKMSYHPIYFILLSDHAKKTKILNATCSQFMEFTILKSNDGFLKENPHNIMEDSLSNHETQ